MIRTRGSEPAQYLGSTNRKISLVTNTGKRHHSVEAPDDVVGDPGRPFPVNDQVTFLSPAFYESGPSGKTKQSELRDLASRLISAQEEERRRIARELHDDLSQEIALLSIHLEQLSRTIDGPESIKQCCLNLQDHVREISKNIYRLSYSLHPSKLEHFGLTAALNGLCQQFSVSGGLQVKFDQRGSVSELPKDVTLCIFRVAQEALRNCAKHSNSEKACLYLSVDGGQVRLSISDQGCGFEMSPETLKRGLGFTSMRERVMIVGGAISVHSAPRVGTSVEAIIPLQRRNVEREVF